MCVELVMLELIELVILEESKKIKVIFDDYCLIGLKFVIDDFGIGYFLFVYLS